ncbi:MerR family transcriptional regulator [Schinkia azotoformans]|uniref:hypothetical protein n=1 Tax=Schinkia azotoformans TaxID=1454 RepID=UPI002DB7C390|nr:hypothetical protein [Schinkia azotoformans]MEC1716484.1 hypothetical protein [Schinkia azotoformans]MEC1756236.1 hypothetical protein [Schinkia azotoformans]
MNYNQEVTAKNVIEILNIGSSTLRKWCIALEEAGYLFNRDSRNQRLFNENDIAYLKYFRQLVQENRLMLRDAVIIIVKKSRMESPTLIHNLNKMNFLTQDELVDEMMQLIRIQRRFFESQEKVNNNLFLQLKDLNGKVDKSQEELKTFIFKCNKQSEERLLNLIKNELEKLLVEEEIDLNEKENRNQNIMKKLFEGIRR